MRASKHLFYAHGLYDYFANRLFGATYYFCIRRLFVSLLRPKPNLLKRFIYFFYTAIAYVGAAQINTMSGISLSGLLGLYEAVLGFKILQWLKADIAVYRQALEPMMDQNGFLHPLLVTIMVLAYMFIGWMGTLLV